MKPPDGVLAVDPNADDNVVELSDCTVLVAACPKKNELPNGAGAGAVVTFKFDDPNDSVVAAVFV